MRVRRATLSMLSDQKSDRNLWMETDGRLTLPRLAMAVLVSFALAFGVSACENVASFTQPTLVRVIDASYAAPAIDVVVEGTTLAGNIGQGSITPYGTLPVNTAALIKVTAATGGATLVSTNASLLAGHQNSVLLADNAAAPAGYNVTILADQQIPAASGHSAFPFLNQALKTGAVDIYLVPAGVTLANSIPIVTALPVGGNSGYISFISQTVSMVVTPTGTITPRYTSAPIALTGSEVRTALLVDTQLTSDPPVEAFIANDVD